MVTPAQLHEVPSRNMILLVGPPGAGKSTFCYLTVVNSLAAKRPIIFVATEHAPSDIANLLKQRGLGEVESGTLSFIDAYHGTMGLPAAERPDTINSSCEDLTSIEVAISKLRNKIGCKDILLVFDSLTSPYLLNGQETIKFLRLGLARFVAEGNSVLASIDEGCGKPEDLGAMMSIANGIIRMRMEEESRILSIVKHPIVKPTTITVPGPRTNALHIKSLNEKLDWIIRRIDYLEMILTESQKYPEAVGFLRSLKFGTALYGEPLKTLDRLVSARNLIESTSQRDEISRIIINTIAVKGPQNISRLTSEVGYQRGKASRTTVRKKVNDLLQSEALIKEGDQYRLPNDHSSG